MYSSENSHKATSNAYLTSCVGPPGICRSTGLSSRLSDFCSLFSTLLSSPDCLLLLSFVNYLSLSSLGPSFPRPLPVSREISRSGPLCGFRAKADKGILRLTPTHTNTTNAQLSVIHVNLYKTFQANLRIFPFVCR